MARELDLFPKENRWGDLQMAHLVSNGKSFYFNLVRSKSGAKYLRINALGGKQRQVMTLFPNQIEDFIEALHLVFEGIEPE